MSPSFTTYLSCYAMLPAKGNGNDEIGWSHWWKRRRTSSIGCNYAGKLYSWCKALDIPLVADTVCYYAGATDKVHGEVLKPSRELHGCTLLEPIGVVGHIIPWNFPSTMFFAKVSPSSVAGCTMIIKPAEQTPLSTLFYAHLAKLVCLDNNLLINSLILKYGSHVAFV